MAFDYLSAYGIQWGIPMWLIVVLLIWTLVWTLLALWKSAEKKHIAWFIVMGILNTAGILEILYIFIFSKLGKDKEVKKFLKKPSKKKK